MKKNQEYEKGMRIFWIVLSFYQPSRHCMNIVLLFTYKCFLFIFTILLLQFKCSAIYGLSCLICANGNTSNVSLQKISMLPTSLKIPVLVLYGFLLNFWLLRPPLPKKFQ